MYYFFLNNELSNELKCGISDFYLDFTPEGLKFDHNVSALNLVLQTHNRR